MVQANTSGETLQRPSMFLYSTEGIRAIFERIKSLKFRKNFEPIKKGDAHPVLVVPGFMASDRSTNPLRKFLRKIGYEPYPWDMGRNYGELNDLEVISSKIDLLFHKHQQKVSLIGWSLGGVYIRQLAKQKPEQVRQVITLGSPFRGVGQPNNATWVYRLIKGGKRVEDLDQAWLSDLPQPAPVPSTAIYSKRDGVVPWQACMELREDATHQNIEVVGSHFGLGYNPAVLYILADRLAYSEDNWKRFAFEKDTDFELPIPSR